MLHCPRPPRTACLLAALRRTQTRLRPATGTRNLRKNPRSRHRKASQRRSPGCRLVETGERVWVSGRHWKVPAACVPIAGWSWENVAETSRQRVEKCGLTRAKGGSSPYVLFYTFFSIRSSLYLLLYTFFSIPSALYIPGRLPLRGGGGAHRSKGNRREAPLLRRRLSRGGGSKGRGRIRRIPKRWLGRRRRRRPESE